MNMEKTKSVLKKLVSNKDMVILSSVTVAGTVLVWWVWTISGMTGAGFGINVLVTAYTWVQTWKFGYRRGLFTADK